LDGGPLFSVWCLNVYVTSLASVLYGGWVRTGPTPPGTRGRGRVCVPSDVGWSPRGAGMLPAPAGAAGECPPRPYPPERSDSLSGLGALGVDGGGRVAEWVEAIPALEAPEYRRTKILTRPRVGCLYPGERLRAAQCLWAAGAAHLGEGIGRRSARCIGGRLGARWRLPRPSADSAGPWSSRLEGPSPTGSPRPGGAVRRGHLMTP
jgi:hypothetical protein